ncbi:hypothetical protein EV401DRAFT_1889540 [Pisolithus croceorrhizus]|nr:hypothetical protein EV401DRAFT_1889540 [Pisolithus croceorrhizus]
MGSPQQLRYPDLVSAENRIPPPLTSPFNHTGVSHKVDRSRGIGSLSLVPGPTTLLLCDEKMALQGYKGEKPWSQYIAYPPVSPRAGTPDLWKWLRHPKLNSKNVGQGGFGADGVEECFISIADIDCSWRYDSMPICQRPGLRSEPVTNQSRPVLTNCRFPDEPCSGPRCSAVAVETSASEMARPRAVMSDIHFMTCERAYVAADDPQARVALYILGPARTPDPISMLAKNKLTGTYSAALVMMIKDMHGQHVHSNDGQRLTARGRDTPHNSLVYKGTHTQINKAQPTKNKLGGMSRESLSQLSCQRQIRNESLATKSHESSKSLSTTLPPRSNLRLPVSVTFYALWDRYCEKMELPIHEPDWCGARNDVYQDMITDMITSVACVGRISVAFNRVDVMSGASGVVPVAKVMGPDTNSGDQWLVAVTSQRRLILHPSPLSPSRKVDYEQRHMTESIPVVFERGLRTRIWVQIRLPRHFDSGTVEIKKLEKSRRGTCSILDIARKNTVSNEAGGAFRAHSLAITNVAQVFDMWSWVDPTSGRVWILGS